MKGQAMCPSLKQDEPRSTRTQTASGVIRYADGSPAGGLLASLHEQLLGKQRKLGETSTDADGRWRISYGLPRGSDPVRLSLVLKALDPAGDTLGTSPTHFNAGESAVIDLVIEADVRQPPSKFEKLLAALEPLLKGASIASLLQVANRDLSFLSGKAGLDPSDLSRLVVAHRLAEDIGSSRKLGPDFWFALLGPELLSHEPDAPLETLRGRALNLIPVLGGVAVRKALRRALAENDIPERFAERLERQALAFEELAPELSLGSKEQPSFLSAILLDAGLKVPEQIKIVQLLNGRDPGEASALKALKKRLKPDQIQSIETSLRLGELTGERPELVRHLRSKLRLKRPGDVRKVAELSNDQWIELLKASPERIDDLSTGDFPAPSRLEAAAASLAQGFRDAYPTAAFAGDLSRALEGGEELAIRQGSKLARLLEKNEEFDLRLTPIDEFLDGGSVTGMGSAVRDADFRHELKALQRLTKFAPSFRAADALLKDNIHSANGAYRLGESEFVRRYTLEAGLTNEEARASWARAADTVAASLSIVGELSALDPARLPAAINAGDGTALARFPNWNNLFNVGDSCECEHCRSVLSPAAYLADILMFLRGRRAGAGADPNASVASLLHKRRPDIGFLELNCPNALTPLPYVDIVCEVLEAAISGSEADVELAGFTAVPADPSQAKSDITAALAAVGLRPGAELSISQVDSANPNRWVVHGDEATFLLSKNSSSPNFFARLLPNTKADAATLRAFPAHVSAPAYRKLKEASFPHILPFDLHASEVEASFAKMRLQRADFMRAFKASANASDVEIAAVQLGLQCGSTPTSELGLIANARPSDADQRKIWGEVGVANWLTHISNVAVLLDKTELQHGELVRLLELKFIDPAGTISINVNGSCDAARMVVEGLDAPALDRIHRFLRLWRKLGSWSMFEVDQAIGCSGVGNGALDDACIINLSNLMRLKDRFGQGARIEELCALLADLDTTSEPSGPNERKNPGFYQRLFLDKRRIQPLDPAFSLDAVGPTSNEDIRDHAPAINAALALRPGELEALLELKDQAGDPLIGDKLTLANLSCLWRHMFLMRRLKLSAPAWRSLLKLIKVDVRTFDSAATAWAFIEKADRLTAIGLKPEELAWILLADRSVSLARPDSEIARLLEALWQEMVAIRAECSPEQLGLSDASSDIGQLSGMLLILLQKLGRAAGNAQLAVDCLAGTVRQERKVNGLAPGFAFPSVITADIDIGYDETSRVVHLKGVLTASQKADLLAVPGASGNSSYEETIEGFFDATNQALEGLSPILPLAGNEAANLRQGIISSLQGLAESLTRAAIIRRLSAYLRLSEDLTLALISQFAVVGPETILTHLTGTFISSGAGFERPLRTSTFQALDWADRVRRLWSGWKLKREDVDRIGLLQSAAGLPDLARLPMVEGDPAIPIEEVVRLNELLMLGARKMHGERPFLQLLVDRMNGGLATQLELAEATAEAQGSWSVEAVEQMLATLDPASTIDWLLAENLVDLAKAFELAGKLGATPSQAAAFGVADVNETHSNLIRNLLSAKVGGPAWTQLCSEIQDSLRAAKREALTAHLLAQPAPADVPSGKWTSRNDLYAYYLIDVEMGACMLTSRLVQAANSVQLFVQRCLMGLEPEVRAEAEGPDGDSAWHWWDWMSKYRWWEGNVKLFLWPENWIEPELRRDRSEIFRQLEGDLLQGEVDETSVDAAFATYLEGLHKLSQLDIVALHQEDDGADTKLHMFGRTPGAEPHELFYRTFDFKRWSPWAKIERDIPGEYLTPIAINGRPLLFWPVFTEANDDAGNANTPLPAAGSTSASVTKAAKRLNVKLALSDYRNGQWSAPRVSKQAIEARQAHQGDIKYRYYRFFAHDRTSIDGRVYVRFDGNSILRGGYPAAELRGAFDIAGCTGAPERADVSGQWFPMSRPEVYSVSGSPSFGRWQELGAREEFVNFINRIDAPQNDLTLENGWSSPSTKYTLLLSQTPSLFRVTPCWHLSYMDLIAQDAFHGLSQLAGRKNEPFPTGVGSWLPFVYADKDRTFFVAPAVQQTSFERGMPSNILYYPDLKRGLQGYEAQRLAQISSFVSSFDLAAMSQAARTSLEASLHTSTPGETTPPFTDEELRRRLKAALLRFARIEIAGMSLQLLQSVRYHFQTAYHPFVCDFAKLIHDPRHGVRALMRREIQFKTKSFSFRHSYWPSPAVIDTVPADPSLAEWQLTSGLPEETVDFSPKGAFSSYNWELFFHVPLLIANALSRNQRFEEARNWYHYIFNPIGLEGPGTSPSPVSRYWITKPFYLTSDPTYLTQRIENLLNMLAGDTSVPGYSMQASQALLEQVNDWRANPYEPHRIAAYRTVAYQKNVVMRYLDNLLAWGDHLFRKDSMESINEATQIYILAAEILGEPPRKIEKQARPNQESFFELESRLDAMSNALVEVENLVPPSTSSGGSATNQPPLPSLYFCIPRNDRLLSYWDRVADRLYKIRHCQNIDGVARRLALFEPAIDPSLLVRATAAGIDVAAAMGEVGAPMPPYRFAFMVQKANELCNDVKGLGAALLAALEKQDAEELALLRQAHELRALEALKELRASQIDEAKETLNGLRQAKAGADVRLAYYRDIEKISGWEHASRISHMAGISAQIAATFMNSSAAAARAIPQYVAGGAGAGGSPVVVIMTGGEQVAEAGTNWAAMLGGTAEVLHSFANLFGTQASHERRWDEWKLQEKLAQFELNQLDKQILAAEIRVAMAEKERDNLLEQIEDAEAMEELMSSKYTNFELYQWHVGQIANTYFATYQLAHDLAKKAERCFRFELGLQESSYIAPGGYWDSLKKGLLAGETLQLDLRRLETSFLERNRRSFELTKHVSLAQLSPQAWVELRETGRCRLSIPEEAFDLDYPGHFDRVIESVAATLPAVAGPFITLGCTLRLLRNQVRISPDVSGGYPRPRDEQGEWLDDPRFVEANVPVSAIAISSGQNDSGLFELSFRDERYLPFEGAGAVSEWAIELFFDPDPASPDFGRSLRQFDYSTISDLILHIKYKAREDAGELKQAAIANVREKLSSAEPPASWIALDLRRQFASKWSSFEMPIDPSGTHNFELDLSSAFFPGRDAGQVLVLDSATLLARSEEGADVDLSVGFGADPPETITLTASPQFGGLLVKQFEAPIAGTEIEPDGAPLSLRIEWAPSGGGELPLQDLMMIIGYHREP